MSHISKIGTNKFPRFGGSVARLAPLMPPPRTPEFCLPKPNFKFLLPIPVTVTRNVTASIVNVNDLFGSDRPIKVLSIQHRIAKCLLTYAFFYSYATNYKLVPANTFAL